MQRSAIRLSFLPMATDSRLAAPMPRNTLQTRIAIMRRARRGAKISCGAETLSSRIAQVLTTIQRLLRIRWYRRAPYL